MKSTDPGINCIDIDGQKIIFFDQGVWERIFIHPNIDDANIIGLDSMSFKIDLMNKYPEIHLGLGFLSVFNRWMPYIFVEIERKFQFRLPTEVGWAVPTASNQDIAKISIHFTIDRFETLDRYLFTRSNY